MKHFALCFTLAFNVFPAKRLHEPKHSRFDSAVQSIPLFFPPLVCVRMCFQLQGRSLKCSSDIFLENICFFTEGIVSKTRLWETEQPLVTFLTAI